MGKSQLLHIIIQSLFLFFFFFRIILDKPDAELMFLCSRSLNNGGHVVWSPPGLVWCCAQLEYEPSDSLVRMWNYTDGPSLCSFCFSAFCLSFTPLLLHLKQVEKERRRRREKKNTLEYPTENTASFLMVS